MREALAQGGDRLGIRSCEFSIQGNHDHLIAEADDAQSLSLGMQGFGVRMARGLNRMMGRRGKVLSDRFHARILQSPTEVRRALVYVRNNRAIHRARWTGRLSAPSDAWAIVDERSVEDPYSSAAVDHGVPRPGASTYLLLRAMTEIC